MFRKNFSCGWVVFTILNLWGVPQTFAENFSSACEQALIQKFAAIQPYGPRGFITSATTATAIEMASAMHSGLSNGYFQAFQSVYLAANKSELETVDLKVITQSDGRVVRSSSAFYMVTDFTQEQMASLKEKSSQEVTEAFHRMTAQSEVYTPMPDEKGNVEWLRVPPEVLQRLSHLRIAFNSHEKGGYFFSQEAWSDALYHGAIIFSDWESSDTIKKIRRLRRKLHDLGYQLEFNQHFTEIIERSSTMPRREKPSFESRFTEVEKQAWQILYQRGQAWSVALVDPAGHMIAGTFGFIDREKGMVNADSVVYPVSFTVKGVLKGQDVQESVVWNNSTFSYEKGSSYEKASELFGQFDKASRSIEFTGGQPDLARVVVLTLGERLGEAGVKFLDGGMVTPFTATLKGRYFPRLEWKQMVKEAHRRGAPVDLIRPWQP